MEGTKFLHTVTESDSQKSETSVWWVGSYIESQSTHASEQ